MLGQWRFEIIHNGDGTVRRSAANNSTGSSGCLFGFEASERLAVRAHWRPQLAPLLQKHHIGVGQLLPGTPSRFGGIRDETLTQGRRIQPNPTVPSVLLIFGDIELCL